MPDTSTAVMEPEVLKALLASIEHWEQITQADFTFDICLGASHCALCGIFNHDKIPSYDLACMGCPVSEKTGQKHCRGTPYTSCGPSFAKWNTAVWNDVDNLEREREAFRAHAFEELEFLRSLVPQETS